MNEFYKYRPQEELDILIKKGILDESFRGKGGQDSSINKNEKSFAYWLTDSNDLRGLDLSFADLIEADFRGMKSFKNEKKTYLEETEDNKREIMKINTKETTRNEENMIRKKKEMKESEEIFNKIKSKCGLIGTNLTGANLTNADLRETNLTNADLRRANLTDADLRRANLSEANLSEANLTDADLRKSNLRGANLSEANLRGANLSEANLRGANLRKANLRKANLSKANLRETNLTNADLREVNLTKVDLTDADLTNADLRETNLTNADLRRANLTGAFYNDNTQFPESITPEQKNSMIRIGKGANLSGVDLSGTDLTGTDLTRANLGKVDLSGANLDGVNLTNAYLAGANLKGIDLTNVDLTEVDLTGAFYNDNTKGLTKKHKRIMIDNTNYTDTFELFFSQELKEQQASTKKIEI